MPAKKGLYANINAKRKRIAKGSDGKMRKPGEEGAPRKKDFEESAKTAKERPRKGTTGQRKSGRSKKAKS